MLLWGEGATPAVVNVIETVDNELVALRKALNSKEPRRYQDFLVAQGLAPDLGPGATLFDTVRASKLMVSNAPTGDAGQRPGRPTGPDTRYITENVPYALVLASSLGEATGVPTPVVDGLVDSASSMLGRDCPGRGPHVGHPGSGRAGHHRPDRLRPHRSVPVSTDEPTDVPQEPPRHHA